MLLTGLLQKRSSEEGESDSGSGTPIFGMSPPQNDFGSALAQGFDSVQSPPFQVIIEEDLYSETPLTRLASFASASDPKITQDLPTFTKPVEVSINITAETLLTFQPSPTIEYEKSVSPVSQSSPVSPASPEEKSSSSQLVEKRMKQQ